MEVPSSCRLCGLPRVVGRLVQHPPCSLSLLPQFSIYLMDERLPLVPMLKWDHGLPSAPLLARLLPPASPGCPRPLLLGGQGGQVQLLHIAGQPGRWG